MKPEHPTKFAQRMIARFGKAEAERSVAVLKKPDGMTDEQCGDLAIVRTIDPDGVRHTVSLWRGTWRDRLRFLLRGEMWIGVCAGGETQPPIYLDADRAKVLGK